MAPFTAKSPQLPGAFRGGMTLRRKVKLLDHDATISAGGTNAIVAPFGLFGGQSGTTTNVELGEGVAPLKKRAGRLLAGQSIPMVPSSGGGYGDPRQRDRDLVRKDLREERISVTAARDIYGHDES